MPNPRFGHHPNDMPLDEAMGYVTHVVIRCSPLVGDQHKCGRSVTWRTSDLCAKLPRCRTLRDFKERLFCKRCKRRGWVTIEPAGRG